jgi:integrase
MLPMLNAICSLAELGCADSLRKGDAMMSVYRDRKSGNWFYDFWWKGRRIKESTHQKNKALARQMEAARKTDLARGEAGLERRSCPEFRTFYESEFLPWFQATHLDHPRTSRRHQVSSRALLDFFSEWGLDEIDQGSVEKFKAWRIAQRSTVTGRVLRPATVNRELALLRAMFNLAVKQGLVKANPVRGVRFFREDNEQTRVVSYEEEERYLRAASTRLREVATLIVNTGMRPEEVYRLRREDVHLEEGYLQVPFGKTRAARRPIPLNRAARLLLADRLSKLGTQIWVFPSKRDASKPMEKIANTHARTVKRAKLPWFRLYDLRHTWATRAVQSGMDLPTVAKTLGHAKLNMVLRYAHPTEEHQRTAMLKLEQYVAANQPQSHVKSHVQEAWLN